MSLLKKTQGNKKRLTGGEKSEKHGKIQKIPSPYFREEEVREEVKKERGYMGTVERKSTSRGIYVPPSVGGGNW